MNRIIDALAQLNALEVTTLINFFLALSVYRIWRDFERQEAERKNREGK